VLETVIYLSRLIAYGVKSLWREKGCLYDGQKLEENILMISRVLLLACEGFPGIFMFPRREYGESCNIRAYVHAMYTEFSILNLGFMPNGWNFIVDLMLIDNCIITFFSTDKSQFTHNRVKKLGSHICQKRIIMVLWKLIFNLDLALLHSAYFPSTWPKTLRQIWLNLHISLQNSPKL
jgi:hypothetical protein